MQVIALTSSPDRVDMLRELGVKPVVGNLDQRLTLSRLSGLAGRVLHLAPPPTDAWPEGCKDPRTWNLVRALRLRGAPEVMVYGSTSGIYGDCGGDWVDETRRPAANRTARALRRADAEAAVRHLGRSAGTRVSLLRIPGIYAPDREGGTPRGRLLKGLPVLARQDDVFTNHIHADDLARACLLALWRGRPQRAYNVNDDTVMRMGDYYDLAADLYGLPRPSRIPRSLAAEKLPLATLSFMGESRRMLNQRMKKELRVRLKWPTVAAGLTAV